MILLLSMKSFKYKKWTLENGLFINYFSHYFQTLTQFKLFQRNIQNHPQHTSFLYKKNFQTLKPITSGHILIKKSPSKPHIIHKRIKSSHTTFSLTIIFREKYNSQETFSSHNQVTI